VAEVSELDEFLARLPQRSPAEDLAMLEAARDAPRPEPTIIPMPEYPQGKPFGWCGEARYPCALGCGWAHVEDVGEWLCEPFSIRVDDLGSIGQVLTERADERAAVMRARIETAIRDHFAAVHPGRKIPTQGAS
jgi:hypothetical protein